MTLRYENNPPEGRERCDASYQSWLRHRIAKLEAQQADRIASVERQKADLDASVERAQREIDNLKSQQTIGAVK